MPRLEVDNVSVAYGDNTVLSGISLAVNDSEMVAIIGANGAGKTSLLRAISGLAKVSGGDIRFGSKSLLSRDAWDIVSSGIAHVPEGRRVFKQMTVEENLMVGGYRRPAAENAREIAAIYDLFPRLAERRRQLAGTMSGGEQQMVAIGRGLMAKPKLLLLDEPSLGLAPKIVDLVFDTILEINRRSVAVVLVEQNAMLALKTTSRAYLMENGRLNKEGASATLLNDDAVRLAYLGA
jgi:branched-chain amino acid transport system ATP-binding protein